jgi:hypothetical protein
LFSSAIERAPAACHLAVRCVDARAHGGVLHASYVAPAPAPIARTMRMAQFHPAWLERRRRDYTRPDGQGFIRPDGKQYLKPKPYECKDSPALAGESLDLAASAELAAEIAAEIKEIRALQYELAKIKFEIKYQRLMRYLRLKAGYRPDQARVPAGEPGAGQWIDEGGPSSPKEEGGSASSKPIRLAGPLPPSDPPEVPPEKPKTAQERNRIARQVAKSRGLIGALLQVIPWLGEHAERVDAYNDPPKSLEELQEAASTPKRGYEKHHIVEQTPAEKDGFPRSQIDAPENLVRIPTYKHWDINSWYGTPNKDFGGLSPRDYLRGKDWSERRDVGLDALIDHGVLKP